ncbi:MAG: NAD(P)/FAD-dependent oxidoreductase [Bdellovibrionota bacterium]
MSRVAIAGGGLVGSLLSLILKKRNHEVFLFEKRPDLRKNLNDSGRSINLIVTSRGLNALKSAGLLEKALTLTVPVTGRMMHSVNGEQVYQAYGRDPSECNYSISRAELNRFLITKSAEKNENIFFDYNLNAVDFKNKIATFTRGADSKKIEYDILIGADGAGSILRSLMYPSQSPQQANSKNQTVFLGSGYKELFMPLKNGQPALEKNVLHIWPRGSHMLMALPNLDGSFTMTLYLPHQGSPLSFAQLKTESAVQSYFEKYFPDALKLMPTAVQDFLKNPEGVLGTVHCTPWVINDSVALIGDAAHAILPFFGQGMNCGFEDCMVLNEMLDQCKENWPEALHRYDTYQRPNADAIADMALENFYEMSDKVGDQNFLFRKKIEAWLEKNFPDQYRSRYGMITYTLIPYRVAYEAGLLQNEILNELAQGIKSVEELNYEKAKLILQEKFLPFVQKNKINLVRYRF